MPMEEELLNQQRETYRRMLPPQQEGLPLALPVLMEQRLTLQQIEIQQLFSDNQQLAASNIALRQELAATHELLQQRQEIPQSETEKDKQIRLFADRVSKLEVDLRAMRSLKDDLEKLMLQRQELSARLQQEVLRAQADALQLATLKSQVDGLQKELQLARLALEQERKVSGEHHLHRQAMERSYHSVLEEVGRLRIELVEINEQKSCVFCVALHYTFRFPVFLFTPCLLSPVMGWDCNEAFYAGAKTAPGYGSLPQDSFINGNPMQQDRSKNQYNTKAGFSDGDNQMLPGQADKRTNPMASVNEWTVQVAPDGRYFYHNMMARITQWEKPAAMAAQDQSRMQPLQEEKALHVGQYPMTHPAALGPTPSPGQTANYPSQATMQRSLQNAHVPAAFSPQQAYHNPAG